MIFFTVKNGFIFISNILRKVTEIKHLSKFSSIVFIFFNTISGFVLCRLRGAVKLPGNGLLYA